MKSFPTLYKYDNNGGLRKWQIYVVSLYKDNKCFGDICIKHGLEGGAIQQKTELVTVGKNIGRANETTPYDQACLEAESKWNKQKDKGYSESPLPNSPNILPMLAHDYFKHTNKLKYPCYIQPKLDGSRTLASQVGNNYELRSRKNKIFDAVPHINKQLAELKAPVNIIFDGELYVHGMSFQDIISIIKRDDLHTNYSAMEFHIYDCYDKNNPLLTFEQRLLEIKKYTNCQPNIKIVETFKVHRQDDIKKYHDNFVSNGYEGVILRNIDGVYELDSRSHDLLKYKSFETEEFEIVDLKKSDREPDYQCTFVCKTQNNDEFGAKPKGTESLRSSYWTDKKSLIGKMATIKYFEMTDGLNPVPRFPILIGVRDYE